MTNWNRSTYIIIFHSGFFFLQRRITMYIIGIWGSILSSTWGTGPSLSLKSREGYIVKNEKSIKHKFLLSPPSAEPAPDLEVSGAVDVVAEAAGVAPQDGGGGEEEEEEEGEQHGVPERSYTCDSRLANGVLRGPLRPLFNPPTPPPEIVKRRANFLIISGHMSGSGISQHRLLPTGGKDA